MELDLAGPEPVIHPDTTLADRATYTWPLAVVICLVLGAVLVLDWALSRNGMPRQVSAPGLLGLALPLAAFIACVFVALRRGERTRAAWICFGIGAAAVFLGRLLGSAEQAGLIQGIGTLAGPAGQLIGYLGIAIGIAVALRWTTPGPQAGNILLDAALTLIMALLLLERFFLPSFRGGAEPGDIFAHWALPGNLPVALISFFCATLLVLRPNFRLPEFVPSFLLVATAFFLLGSVMDAARVDSIAADSLGLATLTGWTILAATGFVAARLPAGIPISIVPGRPIRRRIHQTLVPGAALILGAAAIDATLRPAATVQLGIACALLGLLLAIRVRRTLQADGEHMEARRLLAQNYALVEVSRALADATDLSRTLDLVARWACQLLDAPGAGVELLDKEQDELEIRALYGLPSHLLGLRTPVDGTLTGSVVRSGRALAMADPGDGVFHFSDKMSAFGTFPTAAAPLHYQHRRLGALFAIRYDQPFDDADLELLSALADQASLAIRNAQLFEQVRALSLTDPLTGLSNRRQLARDLAREFAATRRGRQLIAVLFDLDNFKEYNDQYGHPAGDEALRIFGRALAAETRAMNLAARYGGDEFIALLADTPVSGAQIFIQRVNIRFQEEMDRTGHGSITISAGFAECEPRMKTPDELIAAADQALYRVKPVREGRLNSES